MKKIFFKQATCLFAGMMFYGASYAQSAGQYMIGSGGYASSTGTMDFTLGEVAIATGGTDPVFTQGIQQPNTTGTPLPVRLLSFSAVNKDGNAALNWVTASETNNDRFVIERSNDGVNFSSVGSVLSKAVNGTSSSNLEYNFVDVQPKGKNYYRIRQVDKSGKVMYSAIKQLQFTNTNQQVLSVYPSPAKTSLNVLFNTGAAKGTITVYNMQGNKVATKSVDGITQTTVDVSRLTAGTYTIEYRNDKEVVRERFVKVD